MTFVNIKKIETLLKKGAYVNTITENSLLAMAAMTGKADVIKLLAKYGAGIQSI
jgi:hypothetical protein